MVKTIKIYTLYSNDRNGKTKFLGRFGSKHRMENAVRGLGIGSWFYETEEKEDEYGGTIILSQK
jgi:hypothetical protein